MDGALASCSSGVLGLVVSASFQALIGMKTKSHFSYIFLIFQNQLDGIPASIFEVNIIV